MKLFVGLGNPGRKYDQTRHNTGFACVDALADAFSQDIQTKKFDGLYTKFKHQGEDIILLKPQTYMNNSGLSVIQCMKFFKIDVDDLCVIYDDMDLPVGKLRLREKGSAGGHNGIRSIIAHVGTQNFKRMRVGIGKRPGNGADWVLGHFSPLEYPAMQEGIENCVKAAQLYIETDDFHQAENAYNKR